MDTIKCLDANNVYVIKCNEIEMSEGKDVKTKAVDDVESKYGLYVKTCISYIWISTYDGICSICCSVIGLG